MTLIDVAPVPFTHLEPISLDEVIASADLQTRRDRKYLLPRSDAHRILAATKARVLEIDDLRSFRYESIYFDTAYWDSYLSAARRRPRRFKVRTRTYIDSAQCVLEAKVRDHRGNTVKLRHPYEICDRGQLTPDGNAFIDTVEAVAPYVEQLRPVLTVGYRRTTLVLANGTDRVTIDDGATWSAQGALPLTLRGLTLIETKTSGAPSVLDRALWKAGHRPVTISKYCTGMALLRSELPANKWHRVLHRHVIPNTAEPD